MVLAAQMTCLTAQLGHISLARSCRRPGFGCSNGTLSRTCMRTKDTYQVEVSIDENEPMDAGMRRFRKAVMASNLINECRRRRTFENTQDVKKRKIKERGLRKKRQFRIETFDEQPGLDPAPFSDLFGETDSIFENDLVPDFTAKGGASRRPPGGYQNQNRS